MSHKSALCVSFRPTKCVKCIFFLTTFCNSDFQNIFNPALFTSTFISAGRLLAFHSVWFTAFHGAIPPCYLAWNLGTTQLEFTVHVHHRPVRSNMYCVVHMLVIQTKRRPNVVGKVLSNIMFQFYKSFKDDDAAPGLSLTKWTRQSLLVDMKTLQQETELHFLQLMQS